MSTSGQNLYQQAKNVIPGGTQLLSKRPEMFLPEQWPCYYSRAEGCSVWDLDGRQFHDFSINGVGSCLLGYADPDVNRAVIDAIASGSMCSLNAPEEVQLARLLCEIHPWADMARFTRGGGEAMMVAIRIARAFTGRDLIAFCGYHGWHDWYLSANLAEDRALDGHLLPGLEPTGVPRALRETSVPFRYNRPSEIQEIVSKHGSRLAAIVMEPIRMEEPQQEFLDAVREAADKTGAVLVMDEVSMGFRLAKGGAHLLFDIVPDVAVFAKGISNGHPMGAVIGKRDVMQAAQNTFISSTYWTERIGPVAACTTIEKLLKNEVAKQLCSTGKTIKEGWTEAAREIGLPLHIFGVDALPSFAILCGESLAARTLFTQEMLERGYLATSSVYLTAAHQPSLVQDYLAAASEVFASVSTAIKEGKVLDRLRGPVAHTGFTRLA